MFLDFYDQIIHSLHVTSLKQKVACQTIQQPQWCCVHDDGYGYLDEENDDDDDSMMVVVLMKEMKKMEVHRMMTS